MGYRSTWEQCQGASPAVPIPPLTLSPGLSHPHPHTAHLTAWPVEAGFLLGGWRAGLSPLLHHTSTLPTPCLSPWLSHRSGHALHPCGNCHGSRSSTPPNMEMKGPEESCIPAACGRIYLTSFTSSRTGGKTLQSQAASVTRSRRLLLAICCATNILQRKRLGGRKHIPPTAAPEQLPQHHLAHSKEIQRKQVSSEMGCQQEAGETERAAVHTGEVTLSHLFCPQEALNWLGFTTPR